MMDDSSSDPGAVPISAGADRDCIAQARALRARADQGGLRFEAYLPPALAGWLLDRIERGTFADPSEAVLLILGEHRELEPHADMRGELLRRTVQAGIDNPRPLRAGNEVETRLREVADSPQPRPAVWRKTL
jgi:antitoxin ParD1/3/4